MVLTKRPRTFGVVLAAGGRHLLDALADFEERRPSDALRVALREAARRRGLLSNVEDPLVITPLRADRHAPEG